MASRVQRRRHRRTPCILCTEPIGGFRMELGATWVAHATCYSALEDQLHRKGGPHFATLPRGSEELRTAVRTHLTRIAPQLLRRRQNGAPRPLPRGAR